MGEDGAELGAHRLGRLFGAGPRFFLRDQIRVELRERCLGALGLKGRRLQFLGEGLIVRARARDLAAQPGVLLLQFRKVAQRDGQLLLQLTLGRGDGGGTPLGRRSGAFALQLGITGAEGGELSGGVAEPRAYFGGGDPGRAAPGAVESRAQGVPLFPGQSEFLFEDLVLRREVRVSGSHGGVSLAGHGSRHPAEVHVAAARQGKRNENRKERAG